MVLLINKKLFSRAVKDKRKRAQDKIDIKELEDNFDIKFEDLRQILIEKLFSILSGKTAQGVSNDLGEDVIS